MAENLAYLPELSPVLDESDTSPYYYVYGYEGSNIMEAQTTENYDIYGVLYNWEAAKTGCPPRWHLPSDKEWKVLEMYLGMSRSDADKGGDITTVSVRESGAVGKKLKCTSGWKEKGGVDGNGDNSSGFTALPGGTRYGVFFLIGINAFFWSSSEENVNGMSLAWFRFLGSGIDGDQVGRNHTEKYFGMSVRCLLN